MRCMATGAILSIVLCGCGGGGGGGDDGPVGPGLTPQVSSIKVSAPITQAQAPTETLNFTLTNPPAASEGYYLVGHYTTSGIDNLGENLPDFEHPGFYVNFKPAYTLRPGTYSDTIRVTLCADEACTRQLAPEQSFAVTYTVTQPTGADAPAVVLSTNTIRLDALVSDYHRFSPMPGPVTITYANFPIFPTTTVSTTQLGIESTQYFTVNEGKNGQIDIYMKLPDWVGPGTFRDTITLNACLDAECVNALPPQTVEVEYNISNTVAGPHGYTINSFPILAGDLAWDKTHAKMIVALTPTAPDHPNNLATLDPLTGELSNFVQLPAEQPNVLALSDDDQFLYVGFAHANVIQRYTLPDLTPDISIPLPDWFPSSPSSTLVIKPAPGAPHTVAVITKDDSGNAMNTLIFDDATARPLNFGEYFGPAPTHFNYLVEWGADATTLFGSATTYGDGTGAAMYELSVDGMGMHLNGEFPATAGTAMHFLNGLVYQDYGAIYDPSTHALLPQTIGTLGENRELLPDPALNTIFAATQGPETDDWNGVAIKSYDLGSLAPIASVPLPGLYVTTQRLVRWGTDGLAVIDRSQGRVMVITGQFVAP